ncbi:hypothetical protein M0802_001630 [Mischocyttarus mexicanus]|nr:hypothetical protein M0802_001630 [Mischocyttarus mexicanus]
MTPMKKTKLLTSTIRYGNISIRVLSWNIKYRQFQWPVANEWLGGIVAYGTGWDEKEQDDYDDDDGGGVTVQYSTVQCGAVRLD